MDQKSSDDSEKKPSLQKVCQVDPVCVTTIIIVDVFHRFVGKIRILRTIYNFCPTMNRRLFEETGIIFVNVAASALLRIVVERKELSAVYSLNVDNVKTYRRFEINYSIQLQLK